MTDQDPRTPCIPLWAAPSVEFSIAEEAWLGENYTLSIQVDSEDLEVLNIEWTQVSGTTQNYELDPQTEQQIMIAELLGEHQEMISFPVRVSDSIGQSTQVDVNFNVYDRITSAVEQGDPRLLVHSEQDLLSRIIQEVDRLQIAVSESLAYIFNEQAISYDLESALAILYAT